jgi:hypothetical protein
MPGGYNPHFTVAARQGVWHAVLFDTPPEKLSVVYVVQDTATARYQQLLLPPPA